MKFAAGFKSVSSAADWHIDAAGMAICAVLSIAAYFAAARPLLNSRDDSIARGIALTETHDRATRLLADTRSLRASVTSVQTLLNRVEIPLQPPGTVNERLAELTALASDCGLEVQYIRPGTIESNPRFAQLPLQVAGTGDFAACQKFLHRLREKFPDTGLRAFDLSSTIADAGAIISFNFDLHWFVQSAPTQSAAIDARR